MNDYVPYTSDSHGHSAQHAQGAGRGLSFFQITALLVATLVTIGLGVWFAQTYPKKLHDILITVDQFGFTEVGANEQSRIRTINRLAITYEEKQVLIKRTVFFGANLEMVELALGQPVCTQKVAARNEQPQTEYWVYFIEGDTKPTRLAFQSGELVAAAKSSALDICK